MSSAPNYLSVSGPDDQSNNDNGFKINKFTKDQIELICKSILSKDIINITIDYDDESFLFFHSKDGRVNIADGYKGDYAEIQHAVRENLDTLLSNNTEESEKEAIVQKANDMVSVLHQSLLPKIDIIRDRFDRVNVYRQPFEEPGGDFFWYKNYDDVNSLIVLGDCTGHGVQGAMIAMSVITLLKENFREQPTNLLDAVYSFTRKMADLVEDDNQAGFDSETGFILYNKKQKKVFYVGVGLNLVHKRNVEVDLYSTRKVQVLKNEVELTELDVESGDQLFLCTDGIADQYDKENKKRLGNKKLTELFTSLPQDNTLEAFMVEFNEFRGETGPLDDQSLMIITI
ncbi:MAG: PP2C family protein-serine/threonine phosphatase [Cyclobacteriaceae bacterium]